MTNSDGSTERFPKDFSFGVSTSSFQIEGAAQADGRGPSIWDTFCRTPGRITHGDNGDIACDHYHRLDEDLDLLAELGVDVYRFSIAWPRIQPTGRGPANAAGLAFYSRLIDGLRARGIKPVPTLYHWDLPQALQSKGGWANRDIVGWFEAYAQIVARAFGDSVDTWTTINEPWVAAYLGYRLGLHAPGISDEGQAAAAHHHLLLAHVAARRAIKAVNPAASVGIALNLAHIYAITEQVDDQRAAALADSQLNRSFLDPLFRGYYPTDLGSLSDRWKTGAGTVLPGDADTIRGSSDFLSINTYSPRYVCAPDRATQARQNGFVGGFSAPFAFGLPFVDLEPGQAARTALGWIIEPRGLADLLRRLGNDLPGVPLYISENGAAFADYPDPNGNVVDSERIDYLQGHLAAALAAIRSGVNLRGYWAWSFMDNFEWTFGYSQRFGIVYVDYPTGTRIRKSSFAWFQRLVRSRTLTTAGYESGKQP
jgi:beta-glucosidase